MEHSACLFCDVRLTQKLVLKWELISDSTSQFDPFWGHFPDGHTDPEIGTGSLSWELLQRSHTVMSCLVFMFKMGSCEI